MIATTAVLALTRIEPTDVPWHLATARHALTRGNVLDWPVTNTFSYSFPDHPLFQQYPVYQSVLYGVHRLAGFEGLSVFHSLAWLGTLLLWIGWSGIWRTRSRFHLLVLFVLLGLQRRMTLRPDVLTIPMLLGQLWLIETVRRQRGRSWWPLGALVLLQWLLVNTHQMFTLGLAVQSAFVVHLLVVRAFGGRWGISRRDASIPILPVAVAVVASFGVCLLSPLGPDILQVPAVTMDSLRSHRSAVLEFAPLYTAPYPLTLVLIGLALVIVAFIRRRSAWQPLHLALAALGLALSIGAVRGAAFAVILSAGVFARMVIDRSRRETDNESPGDRAARAAPRRSGIGIPRTLGVGVTLGACFMMIHFMWLTPPSSLDAQQAGLGKAIGRWPTATVAFLSESPPPGRVFNLGWYTGNYLLWDFPRWEVVVDPRFEAYPRWFLRESIAAQRDSATLGRQIERYQPGWLLGDTRLPFVVERGRELVESGEWRVVHVDPVAFVLVRDRPETAAYLAEHGVPLRTLEPAGLVAPGSDIYPLQLLRLAGFFDTFGLEDRATELRSAARGLDGG